MNIFLKPGKDAAGNSLLVRDPVTRAPLAESGEWKEAGEFWNRRLGDKDVVAATPPPAASAKSPVTTAKAKTA
jgi:hypothetical protein